MNWYDELCLPSMRKITFASRNQEYVELFRTYWCWYLLLIRKRSIEVNAKQIVIASTYVIANAMKNSNIGSHENYKNLTFVCKGRVMSPSLFTSNTENHRIRSSFTHSSNTMKHWSIHFRRYFIRNFKNLFLNSFRSTTHELLLDHSILLI